MEVEVTFKTPDALQLLKDAIKDLEDNGCPIDPNGTDHEIWKLQEAKRILEKYIKYEEELTVLIDLDIKQVILLKQ